MGQVGGIDARHDPVAVQPGSSDIVVHQLFNILRERRDGSIDILGSRAGRNSTEPFLRLRLRCWHVYVASENQDGVVRPVMRLEPVLHIGKAGGIQVCHRTDGRMAIGMAFRQHGGKLRIFDQAIGLIFPHALFILNDAALRIELCLRHRAEQMTHAVSFKEQCPVKRPGWNSLKIIGAVEPGRAVPVGGADVLQPTKEWPIGIFRAIEHQMFKQVGKSGPACRFETRPHMIPN